MARPENRSEARSLSLTLPEETFNYLVLLATLGKLGRTETRLQPHSGARGLRDVRARIPRRENPGRRSGLRNFVGWVELNRAFTPVFAGYAKPIIFGAVP